MAGRVDLWIEWGIQPIRCFLAEAPFYFEMQASSPAFANEPEFLPDGRLGKRQLYAAARLLSLSAVVHHLNALVDEVLLILASRILPAESSLTVQAMSRSRRQLLDAIERHYDVSVQDLAGWREVESLRDDSNSLKHRGGSSLPQTSALGIPFMKGTELDVERLQQIVGQVRSWLLELWKATEGSSRSDSA